MKTQKPFGLLLLSTLLMMSGSAAPVAARPGTKTFAPAQVNAVAETSAALAGDVQTADSCSQLDVQEAIDDASDGDIVLVPAGACTWTTPALNAPAVTVYQKAITLQGAGIGQTVITDATTNGGWNHAMIRVDLLEGQQFRLTGFTFTEVNQPSGLAIYGSSREFRVDHCEFVNHTTDRCVTAITVSGYTYGVIAHCNFFSSRVLVSGNGDAAWQRPLSLGTANAVYIEDSTFDTTPHCNTVDANDGGRYVFRHNVITDAHIEAHSGCPCGCRATFSYEVYENTIVAATRMYYAFFGMRGGTGVIFNNTITGSSTNPHISPDIRVDNQRSCMDISGYTCYGPWDRCDGDSIYDGNQPGGYGYPCRDQIGRSTDTGITSPQILEPLYEWNNAVDDATDIDIVLNGTMCFTMSYHIQEGRDYYNDTPRPGYTPYVYPHPLTQDLDLTGSPANERIDLNWTVHAYLPSTSTWRITYYSETAPSPVVETEALTNTARAHSLNGLTNYESYTVTLSTVGVTPPLSDAVRVMPTDIFVYLPIAIKED